jgi:murein L,D-transpeptidase YcbB/YkuD
MKKYRTIEQNGGWEPIPIDSLSLTFKPFDSAATIGKIRQRLTLMGDLKEDSKSNLYDNDLMEGLLNYKKRNGFKPNYLIEARHIQRMNIPIEEYIKTIKINMERCRWIEPELTKASEYLFINIPSFKLFFRRNGKTELESNVFVGEIMTQTAIFSSTVNHIVFSPYWNVPKSIVENELSQAIATDKNFLQNNNMEWFKGNLREKPGLQNPMGLVKFIFPNSNDIYLHDTPAKSLFDSEYRAYSHGCINISKAKELALLILKDDPNWPVERINQAMKGEKETVCILKRKIPIHIGYFTALVNETGTINFYNDVYERDSCLSEILFTEE